MNKGKFKSDEMKLYDLLKSKAAFIDVGMDERPDFYFIKCLDDEIIKTARELLVAADEREEDKDPLAHYATYVSDIKFHTDGTATIKYNGGSLGRVVDVFAKGKKYEKDTEG